VHGVRLNLSEEKKKEKLSIEEDIYELGSAPIQSISGLLDRFPQKATRPSKIA
jgi:hypothetical protein